ncbi:hypothetical protein PCANB_002893 [Pneumocystis canis]|nr:hypothetical protein PCK1_002977 [Pneumocystis canis]KAG5438404.1 hypothetical protein PCANB_002893 [Pneumocystis canis]
MKSEIEHPNVLYPIAVLIDELKHDDVAFRLNAIRRLSTIALALGQERTRNELIPFLDESIDDDDEVLSALAEELGNFVQYIGGPQYAHILLSPLESLSAVEEPYVRDKAVDSLNKIAEIFTTEQIEEHMIPLINRLSSGEWFTSRTSATGLYTTVYKRVTKSIQDLLRKNFSYLCSDETPMVRRVAATNFCKFVLQVNKSQVIEDLIPVFNVIASDDQDSVRLLSVEPLIAIAKVLVSPLDISYYLLQNLRSLTSDKSWRVRYIVADHFNELADVVGKEIIDSDMLPAFLRLLRDIEAEVRTAIVGQIPGFCKYVNCQVVLDEILPVLRDLITDPSQHVRAAWGKQISLLSPVLGREITIEYLLPIFLQLLKDEFPDVRLNIISKLEQVNNVIGIELLSQSLLPAIVTLAEDKQWRVRLAIIEYIPLLASQLGVEFFDEKLTELCMSWLGDSVFSIREAAILNLRKLTEVFGVSWAKKTIIPRVLSMGNHENYLYRMTTIFAIVSLAPVVGVDIVRNYILPTVNNLVNDKIPNIRFNVAKSYKVLFDVLKDSPDGVELFNAQIKPSLEKLSNDPDIDVRFFANMAITAQ